MNNLVAQQQGYSFPMDEIPRTYYPGRGFLTDEEAYPENPFYRTPRYSGGDPNLGNAAGVELLAGAPRYIRGKFAPSGAIIKSPHLDSPYMDEQIRRGFRPMAPPPARPSGPQLFPLAQQLPMGFQNKFVS